MNIWKVFCIFWYLRKKHEMCKHLLFMNFRLKSLLTAMMYEATRKDILRILKMCSFPAQLFKTSVIFDIFHHAFWHFSAVTLGQKPPEAFDPPSNDPDLATWTMSESQFILKEPAMVVLCCFSMFYNTVYTIICWHNILTLNSPTAYPNVDLFFPRFLWWILWGTPGSWPVGSPKWKTETVKRWGNRSMFRCLDSRKFKVYSWVVVLWTFFFVNMFLLIGGFVMFCSHNFYFPSWDGWEFDNVFQLWLNKPPIRQWSTIRLLGRECTG